MRRRLSRYATTGFLILIVCYAYFLPRIENVNSTSRMNLVYAVADQGTIRIDDYHKNTVDKAFFDGHYYTEKSIGPSVVALPVYVAFRELAVRTGMADPPEIYTPAGGYTLRYHAMAVIVVAFLTVSIPSAVAATLLYAFVRRWVTPRVALVTMLAYGLATVAFTYSSQFYSHQMAASAMFAAFFILWRVVAEGARPAWAWLAGALTGFAVITEYVTVVFAALMLAWVLYERRSVSLAARAIGAAVPWGLLAAAYNVAAFRTPLPVGYSYTVHFADVHSQGFMGFTLPSWTALYGITFSPYRGLFFLSPFLLLAGYGFFLMWNAGQRWLAALLASMCAILLLYNASFVMWSGGFAVGPRHLIPMLPFLCVAVAWALQRATTSVTLKVGSAALIAVSVAAVWIQTLGGSDFPADTVTRPLTEYSLPHLLQGDLSLNVGMVLGLGGLASLIPWMVLVLTIAIMVPRVLPHVEPATEAQPIERR